MCYPRRRRARCCPERRSCAFESPSARRGRHDRAHRDGRAGRLGTGWVRTPSEQLSVLLGEVSAPTVAGSKRTVTDVEPAAPQRRSAPCGRRSLDGLLTPPTTSTAAVKLSASADAATAPALRRAPRQPRVRSRKCHSTRWRGAGCPRVSSTPARSAPTTVVPRVPAGCDVHRSDWS
jgi:hypothetical protein